MDDFKKHWVEFISAEPFKITALDTISSAISSDVAYGVDCNGMLYIKNHGEEKVDNEIHINVKKKKIKFNFNN